MRTRDSSHSAHNAHSSDRPERASRSARKEPKAKFQEEREEVQKAHPIRAMNPRQAEYMALIESKSVVVATGWSGSSKTWLPTAMAADKLRVGTLKKLVFCRPAVSNSKSIGFFSGSKNDKLELWLAPVLGVLRERLGDAVVEIAIKKNQIEMVPMETLKGHSFSDCFVLLDEAEDLSVQEVKKIITRMGKNSTLVLAGDHRQSELGAKSGLRWLIDFSRRQKLGEHFGFVDFDLPEHIVRSRVVKDFIIALGKEGELAKSDYLYNLEQKYD